MVWNNFLKVIHWLKKGICWNIGNGKYVLTGIDPFISDNGCPYLPSKITEHLAWIDMRTLDVLKRPKWEILKFCFLLNARDLGLSGQWEDKWDTFI